MITDRDGLIRTSEEETDLRPRRHFRSVSDDNQIFSFFLILVPDKGSSQKNPVVAAFIPAVDQRGGPAVDQLRAELRLS